MVCIADPRESAQRTDHDGEVSDHPHDQDGVVAQILMDEVHDNLVQEPDNTRKGASTVYPAQMLRPIRSLWITYVPVHLPGERKYMLDGTIEEATGRC